MNILVLGGSYFLGKHFTKLASEKHAITVFNRGNNPLKLSQVSEIYGNRHDTAALKTLTAEDFDAVVDFCAYEKGDIRQIFDTHIAFKQYIFISTCDVYERGTGRILDENAPFETRDFGGEAGSYILGKVALEGEMVKCAMDFGKVYTSIRPAFIYGPDNYAPRENMYFNWIRGAGQILNPSDATGKFQMVYVDDVAQAILNAIGNPKAYNRAYNLAPTVTESYDTFADALKRAVDVPFEKVQVTVDLINERNIPLPFPLTIAESNEYDGRRALELIDGYTDLACGLKAAYEYFKA